MTRAVVTRAEVTRAVVVEGRSDWFPLPLTVAIRKVQCDRLVTVTVHRGVQAAWPLEMVNTTGCLLFRSVMPCSVS